MAYPLTIIAGPCSVDEQNRKELLNIAAITVDGQRAVWGLRCVGLKSKTDCSDGFMGIDWEAHCISKAFPSVEIAREAYEKTGRVIATELVDPQIQLKAYRDMPDGSMLFWNPASNQIGYQFLAMAQEANRKGWHLGIKNGKWHGDTETSLLTNMEKTWKNHLSFVMEGGGNDVVGRTLFIYRGVDMENKDMWRYQPLHRSAERVKELTKRPMLYDPSHTSGPKRRNFIVDDTIKAMRMQGDDGRYLYDGILIEVGTSQTDTKQHLTVREFEYLCQQLGRFREFAA